MMARISAFRAALVGGASVIGLFAPVAAGAQTPLTEQEKANIAAVPAGPIDAPPSAPDVAAGQAADEEIVVTGFRGSLASALNQKRSESGIVDVIKAEDIADFPDLNLAESLQRIPGVAISRVNGEGRQISVRGLGSEYTRVRINGMEAISTTGGTDNSGGVNRGRGFDFNIFASELFNSLAVRKTASADVEEGSLGATVDLQTARPFDYRDPQLVLSAQASYNDLARKVTPRLAVLASHNFLDNRIGVLVSVAYDERRLLEEGSNNTRWTYGGFNGGFNAASTVPGLTIGQINSTNLDTAIFHPRIPAYVSYDIHQKRFGLTGSVQFQATDTTLLTIDGLFSKLKGTRDEAQLQAIGFSRSGSGKPQTIIRTGVIDGNNNLISGEFDNVDLRTQARFDKMTTTFKQFTGTLTQDLGDTVKLGAVAGYADSDFRNPIQTTVTFDRANSQDYTYDFSTRLPGIGLGFDPTAPASWSFTNGTSEVRIRPQTVRNQFTTAKGYVEWDVDPALKFKAGLDFRRFEYDSTEMRRLAAETVVNTISAADLAANSKVFSGFGRNMNLPDSVARSWLIPDLDKFAAAYDIYSNTGIYRLGGIDSANARGSFVTVREDDLGGYLQGEFHFDALGMPIRGDLGVRHVRTKQHSTGYAATSTLVELVEADRIYSRSLPSFNIAADLAHDVVLRFGAAETLARANIASLSPGGNVSVQGGNRTFSRGNPGLDPTSSKNLDLSLEWYNAPGGLVAVSAFYKNIDTFAQTLRQTLVFSTLGLPVELLAGTGATPNDTFEVSQPVNSKGGKLKGIEVNIQQQLSFLPGLLSNFGVLANYTYVTSDIEYLTSTTPGAPTVRAPLVGLSKNAANGTLYYETDKFGIRGSVSYRSKYLTQVPGTEGNAYNGTNSTINVDLQASYNVSEQLKLSVEAVNLTDEQNDLFVDETNRLNVNTHSGRQFFLGARYSF
jgi:TonB-dependent receptor